MPAYNAERFIRQSVQSVLGQTFEDFELLVVDDSSTDETGNILSSIQDQRLHVLRNQHNLGIVGSLNHGMTQASGRYIARIDADDFCLPTRFAKQKDYLDLHPDVVMVGTQMSVLSNGQIRRSRLPADPDPVLLHWQFYTANPLGHSSMMFRASAVGLLDSYLREAFQYAEDFDFSHRMLQRGGIAVLPEFLVIYRHHDASLTRTRRNEMMCKTAAVLRDAYTALLGVDSAAEALLAAEHFVAGTPVRSLAVLARLGLLLNRLVDAFVAKHDLSGNRAAGVIGHAARLWWATIQTSLRAGTVIPAAFGHDCFRWSSLGRPGMPRLARSAVSGVTGAALQPLQRLATAIARPSLIKADGGIILNGVGLALEPIRQDDPPSLYVEVDTEAEFDWGKPFERGQTAVNSIGSQWRAQAIFDAYGLRPIYVVDYAVASQAMGYEPLRGFLNRHSCVIGAHLHPWINPPFEETVSDYNSFAGNLPAELEEQKLAALIDMIDRNFKVFPLFYKAGRYGIGPHTMQTLARMGLVVDFSIMPKTDMRQSGGVDFRSAEARPYRTEPHGILSVPMAREQFGLVASLSSRLLSGLQSPLMTALHVPGMLSRLGLANTVTLTPEGVTAEEQIRLIRAMMRRGYRTFVMHYHSPSLVAGNTQYVRSDTELVSFLRRIEDVCRFFFGELGGLPGNPVDLLPPHMRECAWPQPQVQAVNLGEQPHAEAASGS
ncbi:glycosyltransferase [Rhodopila sp.]|uniref:glycosyltransferase n=1 Tax=Rhodopila sp. TaxID=2480087 RepID=UPI003D10720B